MNLPLAPRPAFLQIEPVGQCNLRCQMCPIQFRRDGPPHGPPAFMSWDLYTRLIDQTAGLARLQLQGLGEPMMHPRFFDMVEYAVGLGIEVSTNTNLTLLNENRAERCVTSGLAELHASLDGASAETYERIRVRAYFDRVIDNLRRLMQARARLRSKTPSVRIVCVLMRQNLAELPDLVRLAAQLGIDSIFVQHLCHDFGEESLPAIYKPMRAFVEEQTLLTEDSERIERWFDEARQAAAELGVVLRLPNPRLNSASGEKRCDWPWTGAYVSFDGLAMPCCMVGTPDRATLGNFVKTPFDEVWNGRPYQDFREALRTDQPPSVCQSCAVYHGMF